MYRAQVEGEVSAVEMPPAQCITLVCYHPVHIYRRWRFTSPGRGYEQYFVWGMTQDNS